MRKMLIQSFTIFSLLFFTGCGGGGKATTSSSIGDNNPGSTEGDNPDSTEGDNLGAQNSSDEFNQKSYRGLNFYYKNIAPSKYKLDQLTNSEFNALSEENKLLVADKILTTLYFGYPLKELKTKIASGNFLDNIHNGLETDTTDKVWLEDYLLDSNEFKQHPYNATFHIPQANRILSRFYAMKDLDKYFFNNWVAYTLTQTIMFSPAYELTSVSIGNITGVYNRLTEMLQKESGMRYITYQHMMSIDNWRRFRSPEDNGREMLEIYLQDFDDTHVPLSAQALRNWKLHGVGDTLERGLNKNTVSIEELTKFFGGEEVITGEDFFRELAKSSKFTHGVTRRLVDFFFSEKSEAKKQALTSTIVSSKPETWQDILLQIIFSEEYLLHNNRGQSAEETFFSLAKKMNYQHYTDSFNSLRMGLETMHQASMKYKLGKLERVPQDTLSFAHYYTFIRDNILFNFSSGTATYSTYYSGWKAEYIGFDKFTPNTNNHVATLKSFVDYLFESTIARKATVQEHALFKKYIIETKDGKEQFRNIFNIFIEDEASSLYRKRQITIMVMDYISQTGEIFTQSEVN